MENGKFVCKECGIAYAEKEWAEKCEEWCRIHKSCNLEIIQHAISVKDYQKSQVIFGGGCFWCTEAVFKMLKGVYSVVSGYSGGIKESPTYEEVCSGKTGHAEVVKIEYDPNAITFENLLTVFFATHDPTTRNRQGDDIGQQYRSVIFYMEDEQKNAAKKFIKELNVSSPDGKLIVTEVLPFKNFYEAEDYHRDYYSRNPQNPYCQVIINPKLKKVQEKFAELLNNM